MARRTCRSVGAPDGQWPRGNPSPVKAPRCCEMRIDLAQPLVGLPEREVSTYPIISRKRLLAHLAGDAIGSGSRGGARDAPAYLVWTSSTGLLPRGRSMRPRTSGRRVCSGGGALVPSGFDMFLRVRRTYWDTGGQPHDRGAALRCGARSSRIGAPDGTLGRQDLVGWWSSRDRSITRRAKTDGKNDSYRSRLARAASPMHPSNYLERHS